MRGLSNLICKNMVNNPIYEESKSDPTYESVLPQLRIQLENIVPHRQPDCRSCNNSCKRIPGSASADTDIPAVVDVNTVRYVDHPMKLSHVTRRPSLGVQVPFSDTDHCCNNTSVPSLELNKTSAGSGFDGKEDVEKNNASMSHLYVNKTFALGSRESSATANVTAVGENHITMDPVMS